MRPLSAATVLRCIARNCGILELSESTAKRSRRRSGAGFEYNRHFAIISSHFGLLCQTSKVKSWTPARFTWWASLKSSMRWATASRTVASSVSVDAGTRRANPIATVHIGKNDGRDALLPPCQCKSKPARLLRATVWANRRRAEAFSNSLAAIRSVRACADRSHSCPTVTPFRYCRFPHAH
jgi:hypothetical protein